MFVCEQNERIIFHYSLTIISHRVSCLYLYLSRLAVSFFRCLWLAHFTLSPMSMSWIPLIHFITYYSMLYSTLYLYICEWLVECTRYKCWWCCCCFYLFENNIVDQLTAFLFERWVTKISILVFTSSCTHTHTHLKATIKRNVPFIMFANKKNEQPDFPLTSHHFQKSAKRFSIVYFLLYAFNKHNRNNCGKFKTDLRFAFFLLPTVQFVDRHENEKNSVSTRKEQKNAKEAMK